MKRSSRMFLTVLTGVALGVVLLAPATLAGQRPPDAPPLLPPEATRQAPGQPVPPPGPLPQPPPPPQGRPGQPGPPPEHAVEPSREPGQPVNVKIDLTITDQRGSNPPVKKVVSMTLADREQGMIRSQAEAPYSGSKEGKLSLRPVPLHVDARPVIGEANKIHLRMSLEYNLIDESVTEGRYPNTEIRESLGLVLENGKPLIVAQSADPIGDRRVTLEVKATILR